MIVSKECAERGCAAHDSRVDGPGVSMREHALLVEMRNLLRADLKNEILQLERKLKAARAQRDKWHEAASRYRKQLLEERKNVKRI